MISPSGIYCGRSFYANLEGFTPLLYSPVGLDLELATKGLENALKLVA